MTSVVFCLIVLPLDPLEQFEVLSLPITCHYPTYFSLFNTLSIFFLIGLFIFAHLLIMYSPNHFNNYDFITKSLYYLVKNVMRENLYIKKQQYFSVIFYLFFVILLNNLIGLIPYSFTVTSAFIFTFFIAGMHFIGLNIILTNKHQWKSIGMFLPAGAPFLIAPFLIIIEWISYVARIFSLSIRLFANMMAGHALLKILSGFSWAMITTSVCLMLVASAPWLIVTIILVLELLIGFLQAYVFTILVTIYINDVLNLH